MEALRVRPCVDDEVPHGAQHLDARWHPGTGGRPMGTERVAEAGRKGRWGNVDLPSYESMLRCPIPWQKGAPYGSGPHIGELSNERILEDVPVFRFGETRTSSCASWGRWGRRQFRRLLTVVPVLPRRRVRRREARDAFVERDGDVGGELGALPVRLRGPPPPPVAEDVDDAARPSAVVGE
eukprot:gene3925-biopygen8700